MYLSTGLDRLEPHLLRMSTVLSLDVEVRSRTSPATPLSLVERVLAVGLGGHQQLWIHLLGKRFPCSDPLFRIGRPVVVGRLQGRGETVAVDNRLARAG